MKITRTSSTLGIVRSRSRSLQEFFSIYHNSGVDWRSRMVDWLSGRAPDSGSTGCEFESHHCFNSLTALGKLLTTNVHPVDPGGEWVPGLGQYLPFCS